MDSASRPALLLVVGRSVGLAASFAIGIVLARLFDPAVFGTYKQFFLVYATLYGVLQLGMAESLYYFVPRAVRSTPAATSPTRSSLLTAARRSSAPLRSYCARTADRARWLTPGACRPTSCRSVCS